VTDPDPPIPAESKLTRTKQLWARAGKFLTGETAAPEARRLPPGQHLVRDWPILDLGLRPDLPLSEWRLQLTGLVDRPLVWDWAAFQALPQSERRTDIHCVTTWSRYDNLWGGVTTSDLIAAAGVRPEARFVVLHAFDGYAANLSMEDFSAPDAILASSWEGKALAAEHGGPVRLVVPHLYFWKSAKWLRRIDFLPADAPGYWEVRGYHTGLIPGASNAIPTTNRRSEKTRGPAAFRVGAGKAAGPGRKAQWGLDAPRGRACSGGPPSRRGR
jgi:DMSO/TMAO reductase YedYZ molybdopterin-dependent catalytic subunit